jgi:hypothetical protein
MACLAHDDWPSDDEEFEQALKERINNYGQTPTAESGESATVGVPANKAASIPDPPMLTAHLSADQIESIKFDCTHTAPTSLPCIRSPC